MKPKWQQRPNRILRLLLRVGPALDDPITLPQAALRLEAFFGVHLRLSLRPRQRANTPASRTATLR